MNNPPGREQTLEFCTGHSMSKPVSCRVSSSRGRIYQTTLTVITVELWPITVLSQGNIPGVVCAYHRAHLQPSMLADQIIKTGAILLD
jgi:hypothetical protein